MKCIIEFNSSELIKVINNGILLELAEATSKADESAKVAGEIINQEQTKEETKTKSKKKKAQTAEPDPQPEPQPEPDPDPQPQPQTCGTCNDFTSDNTLQSVGKCDNPAGQNVNGWTPTDNTNCNAYTPPPVQQTIIPTVPPVQQQPIQQPQITPQPAPTVIPTQAPTYKLSDIQLAAQQLMDAGKQPELKNLLAQFGVQALVKLPFEQYANFAAQLRAMGARI